jgi:hypothetical protein
VEALLMQSIVNFFKSSRSILCGMPDIRADRSNCRFTVQQIEDGKPVLFGPALPGIYSSPEKRDLGLWSVGRNAPEQAKKLAELLNEHVLEVLVRTTTDTALP